VESSEEVGVTAGGSVWVWVGEDVICSSCGGGRDVFGWEIGFGDFLGEGSKCHGSVMRLASEW
jgi:hypothetical protein